MKRYVIMKHCIGKDGRYAIYSLFRRKWLFFWEICYNKEGPILELGWPTKFEAMCMVQKDIVADRKGGIFTPFLPYDGKIIMKIRA